ncbi:hypothetical protein YPPY47_1307, partial [Yersinia pestis PY-47]|jgi:hypothetical protein
MSVQ